MLSIIISALILIASIVLAWFSGALFHIEGTSLLILRILLIALGVDPNGVEHDDPSVMRDLQRLCTTCGDKRQCELDLANGVSADKFRDYCPNAFTLDALLQAKQERRRRRPAASKAHRGK